MGCLTRITIYSKLPFVDGSPATISKTLKRCPVIDITGKDKAAVLAALYNASRPLGMGILAYDPIPMTTEEAQALIGGCDPNFALYFDYLKGRVMKVDLTDDTLNPALYDRDNGEGAALKALQDAGVIA